MSISAKQYEIDREHRLSPGLLAENSWCTLRIKESELGQGGTGAFAIDSLVKVCLVTPDEESASLRNGHTIVFDHAGEIQSRLFNGDDVVVDIQGGQNELGYLLGARKPEAVPELGARSSIGRIARRRSFLVDA
jgi:hypothetical protein